MGRGTCWPAIDVTHTWIPTPLFVWAPQPNSWESQVGPIGSKSSPKPTAVLVFEFHVKFGACDNLPTFRGALYMGPTTPLPCGTSKNFDPVESYDSVRETYGSSYHRVALEIWDKLPTPHMFIRLLDGAPHPFPLTKLKHEFQSSRNRFQSSPNRTLRL